MIFIIILLLILISVLSPAIKEYISDSILIDTFSYFVYRFVQSSIDCNQVVLSEYGIQGISLERTV